MILYNYLCDDNIISRFFSMSFYNKFFDIHPFTKVYGVNHETGCKSIWKIWKSTREIKVSVKNKSTKL